MESKDGKIEDNNIVIIDYIVLFEDKEFYKKENEYIYINKDFDMFKLSKDIIGMNKNEEKEFNKTFSKEEIEKIAGKTFTIKLKIKEIKQEIKPELTDDLANQIDENCSTVRELRSKIKNDLQNYVDTLMKNTITNKALDIIIDSFEGEIPESMTEQQLEAYYKKIINNANGDEKKALNILKKNNLTKESYKEKMKDTSLKEIKKNLIIDRIVQEENIEANDQDITEYAELIAKNYKMEPNDLIKTYKDAGKLEMLKYEIKIKKAITSLSDNIKIKKGKKIDLKDFFNNQPV